MRAEARVTKPSILELPAPEAHSEHTPEPRGAALALSAEEFRSTAHELVDTIADFLGSVPDRPVTPDEAPELLRGLLGPDAPLPEHGVEAQPLLRETARLLMDHSLLNGHPRFFGYITGAPAPIGMLGDFLAAAVNPNVGAWRLSPMASEIEAQAVRWIAEFAGYPARCEGLFVSGGNMANMVGLLAARTATDAGVRSSGMRGTGPGDLRVYASVETHTWLQKATDLSGLGTSAIRWVPTDASGRMDTGALRALLAEDLEAGRRPMMVVGTAGTVSTGAVDPLFEIASICRESGVWFHVDGAYGAMAAAVPGTPEDLGALALADSLAVDPHKWLYAPLEAGCILVREAGKLAAAFSYSPSYYHFDQGPTNYMALGPQNSRGFRGLKVWLALKQAGRQGYVRMIGDDIRLSRELRARIEAHPELEAVTQGLSVNTFRFVPTDLTRRTEETERYLDRLNEALLERIQRSGEAFVSNAVVGGRYLLRACIVNFRTEMRDVAALPGIVVRLGRSVDEELRTAEAAAG
jgi:aromatic-L-amino-acid/L-tryptophan decarboxylase